MKKLAECCLNLQSLELLGCNKITNESIYAFNNTANKRPSRLSLRVSCPDVSVDDVKAFWPELEITIE